MTKRTAWKEVSLGEFCEFKYGKSLPAKERVAGAYPVYGSNGQVDTHISPLSDGPTVIIGRKGSLGEVAYSTTSCWPIDTTYYVDSSATHVDLRWLYYRLRSLGLTELNRAAAVPGLSRSDAYRKRLLLPPIEQQQEIVRLLDRVDALRARRRAATALLDDLTQSIFLDMFGSPFTNPKEWPTSRLGDLGELDRGVSKHRPRNDPKLLGGPYPLIQTGDVANSGGYITSFSSTYSEMGLLQSKMWPSGTLCITIAANIAKVGILEFDACFPDSVVGFTADKSMSQYVRVWLLLVQESIERLAPESAQKNINLQILRGLPVPRPPDELIAAFAERVTATRVVAERSQRQVAELDDLFRSVQDRAFRGELWEDRGV
ncbi:restriction endonuclease subunit S [Actinomadura spongiicola]|uniref:Restriction endonuclease subunit S n=1 Tax=Actinomadura spongiicola TaxID=2303421 RepID=A0A372GLU6_9ACTN|nr:restriction endonuclease subunit S [Actinomadura spongiicola]RFS86341.1 restriction endonuclease subunit S [Actinomadura spongiicola]